MKAVGILLRIESLLSQTHFKSRCIKLINPKHEVGNSPRNCIGPQHQHAFPKAQQNALRGLLDYPQPKHLAIPLLGPAQIRDRNGYVIDRHSLADRLVLDRHLLSSFYEKSVPTTLLRRRLGCPRGTHPNVWPSRPLGTS